MNRFVRAGAIKVFVGPNVGLRGRRGVVEVLVHHDDHLHVRLGRRQRDVLGYRRTPGKVRRKRRPVRGVGRTAGGRFACRSATLSGNEPVRMAANFVTLHRCNPARGRSFLVQTPSTGARTLVDPAALAARRIASVLRVDRPDVVDEDLEEWEGGAAAGRVRDRGRARPRGRLVRDEGARAGGCCASRLEGVNFGRRADAVAAAGRRDRQRRRPVQRRLGRGRAQPRACSSAAG